jgi:hypothetical protein
MIRRVMAMAKTPSENVSSLAFMVRLSRAQRNEERAASAHHADS